MLTDKQTRILNSLRRSFKRKQAAGKSGLWTPGGVEGPSIKQGSPETTRHYSVNPGTASLASGAYEDIPCTWNPSASETYGLFDCSMYDNLHVAMHYDPCFLIDRTIEFVWGSFLARDATLEDEDIDAMLHGFVDNEGYSIGDYASGTYFTLRYALRLIDRFRDQIPTDVRCCKAVKSRIEDFLDRGDVRIYADYVLIGGCSRTEAEFKYRDCGSARLPRKFEYEGGRAVYDPVFDQIHVCRSYLEGLAKVVDAYLSYAHQVFGWLVEYRVVPEDDPSRGRAGLAPAEVPYYDACLRLGRIALGAVSTVARTLMHELSHQAKWGAGHCAKNCCMARVALTWQCRVSSFLGLYSADSEWIDWAGDYPYSTLPGFGSHPAQGSHADAGVISYGSICKKPDEGFLGTCQMNFPGQMSTPDDFQRGPLANGRYENPPGCDASGCDDDE